MSDPPRVLVVGLGAVGGLVASGLAAGGARVVGLDPAPRGAIPGVAVRRPGEPLDPDLEVAVLATRATLAREALAPVPPALPVVAVHNGFHPDLGRDRPGPVLRGVVDFAASRRGDDLVCTRPGALYLERAPATERLASAFGSGPVSVRLCDDVERHQWSKLLFNASLDPVAALAGKTLGEVLSDRTTFLQFRRLFVEACRVVRALGVRPARIQGTDPLAFARWLRTPILDRLIGWLGGRSARSIESTMLADVAAGRPTEIHYLNGHLVRMAERAGVEVPAHRRLLERFDERGRLAVAVRAQADPELRRSGVDR